MKMLKVFLLSIAISSVLLAAEIGKPVPDFTLTDQNGKSVTLAGFRGQVVLLDFWASWCGPCRKEMPFLVELDRAYRSQGLVVIGVSIDDKVENIDKFLSKLPVQPTFPILHDKEKMLPPVYKIEAMPTSFLIDRSGHLRFIHKGFKEEYKPGFREEINLLLSEGS